MKDSSTLRYFDLVDKFEPEIFPVCQLKLDTFSSLHIRTFEKTRTGDNPKSAQAI